MGNRPMHLAAAQGHLEVVQMLLEHGGSLNQRNKVRELDDLKTPV
jgi:ankyrin repeat protein